MRDLMFWGRVAMVFAVLTWVGLSAAATASAFEVDLGNGTKIDCSVELIYAAGWRVKDQDKRLLSDINADDGNRNFDKWDMMNNRISGVMDFDLQHKNYGLFLRPRAYFDWAYDGSNANHSFTTNNNASIYGGSLSSPGDHFTDDTQDTHRDKIELLDAFVYGTFDPAGHHSSLRIGRQVVSWGESLFLQNSISSAQSPIDATAANVPGVELKDIFLPVGQVSAQTDITSNFSIAGYYQWEWEKNRLDEDGSYFSTSDIIDNAGHRILVPVSLENGLAATIDRTRDREPDGPGQWGIALRYVAEALGDTEFGLYYINYDEKFPMIRGKFSGGTPSPAMKALGGDWGNLPVGPGTSLGMVDPATAFALNLADTSSYYLDYAENVQLFGVSASGVIGETNVAGEVSYRKDLPVQVVDTANILGFSYADADVLQAQISAIHLFGEGLLWDNLTFTGEVGFNEAFIDGSKKLYNDKFAWGFTAQAAFEYYQILNGLDLKVPVTLKMNPHGVSSATGTFVEDKDSLAVNFNFTYNNLYQFGIGYTEYLHSADKNPLADRDFLSANLKYTF